MIRAICRGKTKRFHSGKRQHRREKCTWAAQHSQHRECPGSATALGGFWTAVIQVGSAEPGLVPHEGFSSDLCSFLSGSPLSCGFQPLCSCSSGLLPVVHHNLHPLPHPQIPRQSHAGITGPGQSLSSPPQPATVPWILFPSHLSFQRAGTVLLRVWGLFPSEKNNLSSALVPALLPQLNWMFLEDVPSENPAFISPPCNNNTQQTNLHRQPKLQLYSWV